MREDEQLGEYARVVAEHGWKLVRLTSEGRSNLLALDALEFKPAHLDVNGALTPRLARDDHGRVLVDTQPPSTSKESR